MQKKTVVKDKVKQDKGNRKKYKIEKDNKSESDLTIEIVDDGDYEIEKLSIDGLPTHMADGIRSAGSIFFLLRKMVNTSTRDISLHCPRLASHVLLSLMEKAIPIITRVKSRTTPSS
ncbi:MAG: hypothetical protein IPL71_12170 [Anaerolineales bacterium]|uniref:hypothetical protein n=1 Tax=Candidatus Villigracilis proximus TaxID=3140683 RepID=UPI00313544DF|nr:hypothetical protein [Anaerolineales bacterium]